MIDASAEIVAKLKQATSLDVYYELAVDSSVQLPVVTYQPYNNFDDVTGETFGYSKLQYTIKLWDYRISSMLPKLQQIDAAMRELGFRRLNKTQLLTDSQICEIMLYEASAIEDFE